MQLVVELAKQYAKVLAESCLEPGTQRVVRIGSHRILLVRTQDKVFAVQDLCPHALLPLVGAEISGACITCPRHGARFDLITGKPLNHTTTESINIYPVRIKDGNIQIALEAGQFN